MTTTTIPPTILDPPGDNFTEKWQLQAREYDTAELERFKAIAGNVRAEAAAMGDRNHTKYGQCYKLLDAAIASRRGFTPGIDYPPKPSKANGHEARAREVLRGHETANPNWRTKAAGHVLAETMDVVHLEAALDKLLAKPDMPKGRQMAQALIAALYIALPDTEEGRKQLFISLDKERRPD